MGPAEARRPCASHRAAERATFVHLARFNTGCNASLRGSSPEHTRADNPPPVGRRASGSIHVKVSVVIPCLNEAASIERCVARRAHGLRGPGLAGRGDRRRQRLGRRQRRARARRRRAAWCTSRGAATAARTCAGFAAAQGDYIVMADADLTYDFGDIPRFVEQARRGRRPRDGRPHDRASSRARCRGCTATSATRC